MLNVLYLSERMDQFSFEYLPDLARNVRIHLVTSRNSKLPEADFASVTMVPPARKIFHQIIPITWQALKILRRQPIDVIHVEAHAGFLLPTRVPMVVQDRGCWRAGWRNDVSRAQGARKLRFYLTAWLHYVVPEMISVRRATHLLTMSKSGKDVLQREYRLDESKITVNLHSVPPQLEKLPFLKGKDDSPSLIFTGRLYVSKGILEFARLFSRSCQLPVKFTIVGGGPERFHLEEVAKDDPRLTITGYVQRSEVFKHLESSNVFVFPSFHEGFGMSVLEAMATGHACVTLDIPAMREVLGPENGRLCSSMDEMMEAVVELCNNPELRYDLQRRAWERSKEFSWERSAERIVEVYRTVAGRKCGE